MDVCIVFLEIENINFILNFSLKMFGGPEVFGFALSFLYFFFQLFERMELFKTEEMKKEFDGLIYDIIPSLNECGNCRVLKCDYCS